ncbi:MAG: zinc ribbon domain-containing protein [Defluviitaleaceae bacterium]|nr:zinc ribbon domain-containing protein [Defluviitaleaceae bacterium]
MADIFGKIKDGVTKSAATVSANSKAMVKKSKIKAVIEGIEKEQEELIFLLGQRVYEICNETGEINIEDISGFIAQISQRIEHIAEQEEQLRLVDEEVRMAISSVASNVSNNAMCPCGHVNQPVANFCAKCGNQV